MRIVLGIGNPGKRYKATRHNIGFLILDAFAERSKLSYIPSKSDYYYSESVYAGNRYVLIKPSTYVNNSGIAAVQALEDFDVQMKDMLVIVDDINLNIGTLRLRASGGDGGHNGMKSIIYHTASNDFPRIRIGIGSEFTRGDMADYVLSKFHKNESGVIRGSIDLAMNLIDEFIMGGIKRMLDFYSADSKNRSEQPGN